MEEILELELNFTPPLYFYHLSGGLSLLQGENDLCWLCENHSDRMVIFSTLEGEPRSALKAYSSIRILGRSQFENLDQMREGITDNFALYVRSKNDKCQAFEQSNFWNQASTGFLRLEKFDEHFMAQRMATQIRKSVLRLEKLSIAYRTSLSVYEHNNESEYHLTQDKYSAHIGGEFATILDDLYALRDALNALIYRIIFEKRDGFTTKKFKSAIIAGLGSHISDRIFKNMFQDDLQKALIARMSTYRAVSLHCLGSSNPIFGDCITARTSNGPLGSLTQLIFPLYDDMEQLKQIEMGYSQGKIVPAPHDDAIRFMMAEHEDALEFAFDCFSEMLAISALVSEQADIPQEIQRITERDIVRASIRQPDGTVRQIERDPETGNLGDVPP